MRGTLIRTKPCPYCNGNGYNQLLLGGSETCVCCKGSGIKPEPKQGNRRSPYQGD
ncbi:hypothetical protein GXN76_04395 [Kroppenstedtia pulmonis]|uniref:YuiA family protein n=1 Tax=Kroppenstedtia pulmonis TaxID=1380685 RepID=A0A7D4BIQ0_9BACL|nr:YuiA family protein [Kroppenstedtia pulmonis]QKG83790.1 hypothetical protein GXN76_04395 [Kroppenstedtia pulmonis]